MRLRMFRVVSFVSLLCAMLAFQVVGCGDGTCQSDADCKDNKRCEAGQCVAKGEGVVEAPPQDAGAPKCPKRCSKDRDCVFCGSRKVCDQDLKECVDILIQCSKVCNSDKDCTKPGCGARTTCNTTINECVERIPACPDSCTTDADCTAGGCGPRSKCSTEFKTCVDPSVANCPFVCKDDAGCTECGARNKCSFSQPGGTGLCREFGSQACPAFCQSTSDCFTKGCGDRIYCNYALGECVNKDKVCPSSCKSDADCNSNCGERTYCYQSAPGRDGYCARPPVALICPDSCRTSFACKAKECGDKVFCNYASNTCVQAANACPGNCKVDADCPADKCGPTATCTGGRCWRR